jgi:hypothetical protein
MKFSEYLLEQENDEYKKGKYTLKIAKGGSGDWKEVILSKGSISMIPGVNGKYYPDKEMFVFEPFRGPKKSFNKLSDVWKYIEKTYKDYADKPPKKHPGAGPNMGDIKKATGSDQFRDID